MRDVQGTYEGRPAPETIRVEVHTARVTRLRDAPGGGQTLTLSTGRTLVTPRPYRLIHCQGTAHPGRFAFGVSTEGIRWVTAAGARPGVDSVTLSDAVARAALRAATTEAEPAPGVRGRVGGAEPGPNVEVASKVRFT